MRIVAGLCFLGLAGVASASFDLMLLPDQNTGRVVRLDPVTGVSLGSFGPVGLVGAARRYVSVMTPTRVAHTGATGTTVYDPNTGAAEAQRNIPNVLTTGLSSGDGLLEVFSNSVFRYDASLASHTSVGTALVTSVGMLAYSYNDFFVLGTVGSGDLQARRFTNMVGGVSTPLLAASVFNVNTFGTGQGMVVGNSYSYRIVYQNPTGINQLLTLSVNLTTFSVTTSTTALNNSSLFSSAARLSIMPAHTGYYVVGDDATNPAQTRISYYSAENVIQSSFATSAVDVTSLQWSGGIILAPEPSSLGVFAVAGAMLLRRRKR
ncbi:MAG: PEP-CTERM sorting domain-containing protein [Chthonomonas sp.]|nr:PEP-CTERM sorting domain-containing protein [Chthonomonas sp.]